MAETMANPESIGVGSGICTINQVAFVIDKSVAYSTFGDDVFGVRGIILEFLAQIIYIKPQVMCFVTVFISPDFGKQLLMGDNPSCILYKVV
jgi:hypothetical protein